MENNYTNLKRWCCYLFLCFCALLISFSGSAQKIEKLSQAQNGKLTSITDPIHWVTGNVNGQKAHYTENMTLPYQLEIINLEVDSVYEVTIGWDTKKNGLHALDFLTSYDREYAHLLLHPAPVEDIDPLEGTGLEGIPGVVENRYPIPAPSDSGWSAMNTDGYSGGDLQDFVAFQKVTHPEWFEFSIFQGSLVGQLDYNHDPFVVDGTTSDYLRIRFVADSTVVVFAWGANIAAQTTWGALWSASDINGSPYHTFVWNCESLDGCGNKEIQLSADAVIIPPPVCPDALDSAFAQPLCLKSFDVNDPDTACTTEPQLVGSTQYFGVPPASGGTMYNWTFSSNTAGASFTTSTDTSVVAVTTSQFGCYTVQVEISNGSDETAICDATICVSYSGATCVASADSTTCYDGNDGNAYVDTILGGSPNGPYSYFWDANPSPACEYSPNTASVPADQDTLRNPQGLTAGCYRVQVTDHGNGDATTTCFVTVHEPADNPVMVLCSDLTTANCLDQSTIDTDFGNWLDTVFTVTGGTEPMDTVYKVDDVEVDLSSLNAPDKCGDSITIKMVVTEYCGSADSCEATFTVPDAVDVAVDGPGNQTYSSCDFLTQAALDAAFTAWKDSFVVVVNDCGADTMDLSGYGPPELCSDSTVTINFVLKDSCTTDNHQASFTINAASIVDVDGPGNQTYSSCDFLTQAALDAAFTAWKDSFIVVVNDCGADTMDLSGYGPPLLCSDSTVTIDFVLEDSCTIDNHLASFTMNAANAVDVDGPDSVYYSTCDFVDQNALNDSFDVWLAQFDVLSNECGADTAITKGWSYPDLCSGDTVAITITVEDSCSSDTYTAEFGVTARDSITVSCNDTTLTCDDDLAAAYAAWVDGFTYQGGCVGMVYNNSNDIPTFEESGLEYGVGKTITFKYWASDDCTSDTVTCSFTAPDCFFDHIYPTGTECCNWETQDPQYLALLDVIYVDTLADGNQTIKNGNPGALFYYTDISLTADDDTIIVTNESDCGLKLDILSTDIKLYYEGCRKVNKGITVEVLNGDTAVIYLDGLVKNGSQNFVLSVKYNASSLAGQQYVEGCKFTFKTMVDGQTVPFSMGQLGVVVGNYDMNNYAFDQCDRSKSATINVYESASLEESELKVYPNPFSDKVTFEFVSGVDAHGVLEIYNITGQRVARILDRPVEAGVMNRIEYVPDHDVTGIYLYRLDLDGKLQIGRIIYQE
ncbi:MAG TPA: T9SS type A sorting domain-containing protein [Draconibacterium sp.]|nr:T9SS type A sorting domain-containing protein [Draconibacterium sp.]